MSIASDVSNPIPVRAVPATLGRVARWSTLAALAALAFFCAWLLSDGTPPWSRAPLPEDPNRKAALNYHLGNGLWKAAAFGLAVALGLLATSVWWLVPAGKALVEQTGNIVSGKYFFHWLAPILLLALVVRVPLLDHSLYGDEHYSITRFIHGENRIAKDGGIQFREHEWKQTIWGYQRPNNHIFFSIVARATHTAWQKLTGAEKSEVNLPVLRVPAMVAAVLSIGVAAWLLWSHGFRTGAVVAALLVALHPWHIAHSVEVRGYGFVFLFLTTTAFLALAAPRNGRWWNWAALAASQFFLLHTYPKAILIAAPVSMILLGMLGIKAFREPSQARALLGPFLASQSLLAVALAFAYLPCLPQVREYFSALAHKGMLNTGWMLDVASLYLVGRYWQAWEPANSLCRSLNHELTSFPWLVVPVLGLLAILGLRGVLLICRKNRFLALMLAPIFASIPLALMQARNTELYIFTWHMIMALPLWLMCVGVGTEFGKTTTRKPFLAMLMPALAFLAFLHLSSPQRRVIAQFPAEPVDEAYASLQEHLAGIDGPPPAVYAMFSLVDFRDPKIRKLRDDQALIDTYSKHQADQSPFLIILPGLHSLRENNPQTAALLESSGEFRLLARHHGIEFAHRSYDLWIFGEK